ncbi:PREDICTED: shugoshin-like 1 [Tinamus guttatus]|uniref:shugoshin-like 1 n=1 Tax=Tinamus guttatus TaxID=94827 RepID=UPI00052EBEE6|nr:PREDICTED: shugoshin-like 1 [Tinamus guttatus]
MAEHLKKTFKDSLGDIKERMKEKRNRKWIKLGKINSISNVKCKKATTSSVQMKSIQANNRALAVALQEEKLKLKEAQDMILLLREECQDLKVQMFDLQRKLRFEKAQGSFKTRLSALNEIISKVSRNLLDSVDLLRPAKGLCFTDVNQSVFSSVLENNSGAIGQMCSVRSPPFVNGDDRLLRREVETAGDGNELAQSMSEICQESENGISLVKTFPDKGQTYDFHLDNAISELENVPSSEKDKQLGNVLPKSVSTRRRYSKMRTQDELCTGALDHTETPDSTRVLSKQDETRLLESLQECTVESINSAISPLNKNTVDSELVLRQVHSAAAQVNSDNSDFKQHEHKSREGSQAKREKRPRKKPEETKNTSRPRSKKRQGKEASKEKSDFLGRCSDAYDFHFEESIHVTPFRQNRVNDTETSMDDKKALPENDSSELSNTEEDSDDSIYVPYKSKKRKSSVGQNDKSPIHPRPRSKRCLAQRELKLQNEKEAKSSKSSDKSLGESFEPSRGLCDVTNTASSLLPGNALAVLQGEVSPAPKRKRSCTLAVSYKEPSIAGKLRRGDPFTDTYFLNSPIFKQKKDARRHSLKASLSKYNEKFVGCR